MATEANIAWERQTRESYVEEGEPPKTPEGASAEGEGEGEEEAPVEERAAEEPADDEEPPPSSKRPTPPAAAKGPKASLAHLAGLPETASQVAITTEITRRVQVYEHAQRLTGATTHGEIIGHLDATFRDAGDTRRMRDERDKARSASNARERLDLLAKLEAHGVHTRGELFVDIVNADGKRTGVRPAKLWGPGPEGRPLANLRGYVSQRLSTSTPKAKTTPFEPDPKLAKTGSARVTEQDQALAQRNGYDPERVAATRQALFGNNGAAARGA